MVDLSGRFRYFQLQGAELRNVLIYSFSGDVDEVFHLFPNERLARIAAAVADAGGNARILDRANFTSIREYGAEFMEHLAGLSFHDTSPLYESVVEREAVAVLACKPDLVFLNLWHGTGFKFSMGLLAALKQRAPHLDVYGVGQKVDEFKEQICRFAGGHFDGLVTGLGYDAVQAIVAGTPRELVPNLLYEADGEVKATTEQVIEIDDYPAPVYDPSIYEHIEDKAPVRSIVLSNQACPNRCAFCVRPAVYGRTPRKRSIGSVMQEIRTLLTDYGIRHFRIEDSTPPKGALTELARAIVDSELKGRVVLSGFSRVDSNSMEDFDSMRAAGVIALFFGIESLDDRTLKLLSKGTDYPSIRRTLAKAHNAGIRTVGSFIFPTPGMTEAAMRTTFARLKEIRPFLDAVVSAPAAIQPNTGWYREPGKYGIRIGEEYLQVAVIYPIKYMVPLRLWKPWPFSYDLLGKPAADVTFEDIVTLHEKFVDLTRNQLKLPGMPDFYFLIADLAQLEPAEAAQRMIKAMMERDYTALRSVLLPEANGND